MREYIKYRIADCHHDGGHDDNQQEFHSRNTFLLRPVQSIVKCLRNALSYCIFCWHFRRFGMLSWLDFTTSLIGCQKRWITIQVCFESDRSLNRLFPIWHIFKNQKYYLAPPVRPSQKYLTVQFTLDWSDIMGFSKKTSHFCHYYPLFLNKKWINPSGYRQTDDTRDIIWR